MLRRDGLVEGNSFRASKIVSFTQKDIEDLFAMRETLEEIAMRQAIQNITDRDVENLKAIQCEHIEIHQKMDSALIFNTNRKFHSYIMKCANNFILEKMLDSISDQAALLRAPTLVEKFYKTRGKSIATEEHARIIEAIEQRDAAKACREMKLHVARLRDEVCTYYKLCDKAGIDHFSMHALRHTYATRAIEGGMPPEILKQLLGHESIKTTMDKYVHVTDDSLRQAVAQFGKGISALQKSE